MVTPLDGLNDAELAALNKRYPWVTATKDSRGRTLGGGTAFPIPERKIIIAEERLGLKGKSVVEFGALEGSHTVALCQRAKKVVALEGQDHNIERLRIRCRLYGFSPEIRKMDLEVGIPPAADLFFHSGVLYHLQDPVGHLERIASLSRELLLDTHYASGTTGTYTSANGKQYGFSNYKEHIGAARSGVRSFSRWVLLKTILEILSKHYATVTVVRDEKERNGPRVTIVARKA